MSPDSKDTEAVQTRSSGVDQAASALGERDEGQSAAGGPLWEQEAVSLLRQLLEQQRAQQLRRDVRHHVGQEAAVWAEAGGVEHLVTPEENTDNTPRAE